MLDMESRVAEQRRMEGLEQLSALFLAFKDRFPGRRLARSENRLSYSSEGALRDIYCFWIGGLGVWNLPSL